MALCSPAALRSIPPSPQPFGSASAAGPGPRREREPAAGPAPRQEPEPRACLAAAAVRSQRQASEGGRGGPGQRPCLGRKELWKPPLHRARVAARALRSLALLAPLLLASAGCQPAHLRPSWRVYPLPRQVANDGLAVVNQPDGYGLHIWLETDTSQEGLCRPRWNPAAARLFNGNGTTPFSSGLATPEEFYEAVQRGPVRQALRRQMEALCRERAPRSAFEWTEPPRRAADYKPPPLASLEERHLLSDPEAIKRAEQRLLGAPPGEREAGEGKPAPDRAQPTAAAGKAKPKLAQRPQGAR